MRQSSDGRGRAEAAERARNAEASAQRAGPCHARDILVAARAAGEGPHMWGLTAITSRRKRPTHNHRGLRQQCSEAEARAAGDGSHMWGSTALASRRKRPTHNHRGLRQQCREAEARAAGEGPAWVVVIPSTARDLLL